MVRAFAYVVTGSFFTIAAVCAYEGVKMLQILEGDSIR